MGGMKKSVSPTSTFANARDEVGNIWFRSQDFLSDVVKALEWLTLANIRPVYVKKDEK